MIAAHPLFLFFVQNPYVAITVSCSLRDSSSFCITCRATLACYLVLFFVFPCRDLFFIFSWYSFNSMRASLFVFHAWHIFEYAIPDVKHFISSQLVVTPLADSGVQYIYHLRVTFFCTLFAACVHRIPFSTSLFLYFVNILIFCFIVRCLRSIQLMLQNGV